MAESKDSPIELPENLVPEARGFIENVEAKRKSNPDFGKSTYGHAAVTLAVSARNRAYYKASEEEQKECLRLAALHLIEEYGKGIIPLLRDELKLALTDEDLASINRK
jgi:hypothetical protein